MSGGHSRAERHSRHPPPGEGRRTPAARSRHPREPRGPGGDRQSRTRPVPSSRGPLAPRPDTAPSSTLLPRLSPGANTPARPAAPGHPAARRPLRRPRSPHLLTSPRAGPQQLCQDPASQPPPALCGRPVPFTPRPPEPGEGGGSGAEGAEREGRRPLAGRGEGGAGRGGGGGASGARTSGPSARRACSRGRRGAARLGGGWAATRG